MTIVSPRGALLPIGNEDLLWLARAVEAEGEPRALVAQTLVNRWAWLHGVVPGAYPRLLDLVRAYAQPVNPRWYVTGDRYAEAVRANPEHEPELRRQALRREQEHATRSSFRPATVQAVQQATQGPVTIPAGAVDYSKPKETPRARAIWEPRTLIPGELGKSNSIFTNDGAAGVLYQVARAGPVSVSALPRRGPGAALAMLGGMGLVGLLAAKAKGGRTRWR